MSSKSAFLNLLFDKDQQTCFSSTIKGTAVRKYARAEDVFFCINALDPLVDHKPELSYHAANKPRRADHNVVCYRNFLLEIDSMPLEDQQALIKSRTLPVSSCVYSGGKSYHFIISLQDPVDAQQYRTLSRQLHSLIPEADSSTKNPSRLSRLPFAYRKDTKKTQDLVYLGERIDLKTLLEILPDVPEEQHYNSNVSPSSRFLPLEVLDACYNPDETMARMQMQSRNGFFYWLGKRLQDLQYTQEVRADLVSKAYTYLENKKDFSFDEALQAARV